jgi:hypothetical protein
MGSGLLIRPRKPCPFNFGPILWPASALGAYTLIRCPHRSQRTALSVQSLPQPFQSEHVRHSGVSCSVDATDQHVEQIHAP